MLLILLLLLLLLLALLLQCHPLTHQLAVRLFVNRAQGSGSRYPRCGCC